MTTSTELQDLQNKASLMSTGLKLDYQVSRFACRKSKHRGFYKTFAAVL